MNQPRKDPFHICSQSPHLPPVSRVSRGHPLSLVFLIMILRTLGCGVARLGCGVAQSGCGVAQSGCGVAQLGCDVAQLGCGVSQIGCCMAQLVVRRLAVQQARVRCSAWHAREVFHTELTSDEEMRGTWANDYGWMYCINVMEWMYVIYNIKINKKSGIMPSNL